MSDQYLNESVEEKDLPPSYEKVMSIQNQNPIVSQPNSNEFYSLTRETQPLAQQNLRSSEESINERTKCGDICVCFGSFLN
jgi:hypothetical protein